MHAVRQSHSSSQENKLLPYQKTHDKSVKEYHSDTSNGHLKSDIYSFHVPKVITGRCIVESNNLNNTE